MADKDVTKLPVRNKQKQNSGLFLVPRPFGKCHHYTGPFEIDAEGGSCTCLECGEDVSPFLVLSRLMNKESRWNQSRERYNDEMKRLHERSRTTCEHCGKMTKISRN